MQRKSNAKNKIIYQLWDLDRKTISNDSTDTFVKFKTNMHVKVNLKKI